MSTTGRGFQIDYPFITLHAISRSGSHSSIYCQLDEGDSATASIGVNGVDSNEGGGDEGTSMRELSIIPQDLGSRTFILNQSH